MRQLLKVQWFSFMVAYCVGVMQGQVLPSGKVHTLQPRSQELFFTGDQSTVQDQPAYALARVDSLTDNLTSLVFSKAHLVTVHQGHAQLATQCDNPLYGRIFDHLVQLPGAVLEFACVLQGKGDTIYWTNHLHDTYTSVNEKSEDGGQQKYAQIAEHTLTIPGADHVEIEKLFASTAMIYAVCRADGVRYIVGLEKPWIPDQQEDKKMLAIQQTFAQPVSELSGCLQLGDDASITQIVHSFDGVYLVFTNPQNHDVFPVVRAKISTQITGDDSQGYGAWHLEVAPCCQAPCGVLPSHVRSCNVVSTTAGLPYLAVWGSQGEKQGLWYIPICGKPGNECGNVARYASCEDITQIVKRGMITNRFFASTFSPEGQGVVRKSFERFGAVLDVVCEQEAVYVMNYEQDVDITTIYKAQMLLDKQGGMAELSDWQIYAQHAGCVTCFAPSVGANLQDGYGVQSKETLYACTQKWKSVARNASYVGVACMQYKDQYMLAGYGHNTVDMFMVTDFVGAGTLQQEVEDVDHEPDLALRVHDESLGFVVDCDMWSNQENTWMVAASDQGLFSVNLYPESGTVGGVECIASNMYARKLVRSGQLGTWYAVAHDRIYRVSCTGEAWSVESVYQCGDSKCKDIAVLHVHHQDELLVATTQGLQAIQGDGTVLARMALPSLQDVQSLQVIPCSEAGRYMVYALARNCIKHQSEVVRCTYITTDTMQTFSSIFSAGYIGSPYVALRFGVLKHSAAWFGDRGYVSSVGSDGTVYELITSNMLGYDSNVQHRRLDPMTQFMSDAGNIQSIWHDSVLKTWICVTDKEIKILQ